LYDNLEQRFPSTDFLEAANSLNKTAWPKDPLQRALFEDRHIALLCKEFGMSNSDAADVLLEYSMLKKSDGLLLGQKLQTLITLLEVLPVSSAECERGFSH